MAKRGTENPSLTPIKALKLLREVEKACGSNDTSTKNWALQRTANELESHIRHGLGRRRR